MQTMEEKKPRKRKKKPVRSSSWGERLKATREARGELQTDVARKFRVSVRSVAAWETGETIPSPPIQVLIGLYIDKKI